MSFKALTAKYAFAILTAALVLFALPVVSAHRLSAAGDTFRIVRGGNTPAQELEVARLDDGAFLDLGELAVKLGGQLVWQVPGEKITWRLDGLEFQFTDMIAFFTAGGVNYQLVAAPRLVGGRFLVPLQLASEFLPRFSPERYAFNSAGDLAVLVGTTAVHRAQPVGGDENFRIRTIVINPGHGGKDPGTTARRYKMQEKDIVLDIGKRVYRKLKKDTDMKILLTRDNDTYTYVGDIGPLANKMGGDLFVSIHVNASGSSRRTNGSKTYFLSEAKTTEDRATEMLENEALNYEREGEPVAGDDELSLILQDMKQNEHLRESQDLSKFIQLELAGIRGLRDNGLGQANFAVLRGSYMPAALVETAYISNPTDEKNLNTPAFRDKLADAIARGIVKYVDQYHRKLASGS